jgi:hypothetical protein
MDDLPCGNASTPSFYASIPAPIVVASAVACVTALHAIWNRRGGEAWSGLFPTVSEASSMSLVWGFWSGG